MGKNITLFGKAYPDTPAIIVPKTGGGTARFDDVSGVTATAADVKAGKKIILPNGSEATGTYNWSWMGSEVEHLSELDYTEQFTLADTDYPNWTPSTAYAIIRDTYTRPSFKANMKDYDYLVLFLMRFDPVYDENASKVNMPIRGICYLFNTITRRPQTLSEIENGAFTLNISNGYPLTPFTLYYNSYGNHAISVGNYGVTISNQVPANAQGDAANIAVKMPSIRVVCNDTVFSTDAANAIIPNQSTVKIKYEVYRVPRPNLHGWIYQRLTDIYNNGL